MTGIFNRRVLVGMLFTALSLTGYISYRQLAVELLPNTELPFLIVSVSSRQEVDPKYMESQAVRTLEGAIGTLENIETIESYSERRQGTIMIYYEQDTDIKYAYLKLQQKVDAVKNTLNENFNVQVINIDTDQMSNQFMDLQIRGGGGTDRVRYITDQKIVNELLNIDGIANASVTGGREKSVEVILNESACASLNITPSQIYQRIAGNNQSKYFVGIAHGQNKKYAINVIAEFADINDLEDVVIREQGPILLKHVAEINIGVKEETSISRVNGKEAITMQLIRDAQVNLIELSHKTHDIIDKLNDKLKSDDVEIVVQNDQAEQIESNIDLIIELALTGGLLAVFVLWIFLRNLRLVIIMMLAIPISVLTAFNFFYLGDISLNSLTLVGMALAIGMLLDSSVVVLENIYRLYSQKGDAAKAVTQGTREVWRSIFAATFTTIAVFVPFLFTDNFFIKIFGRQIGYSIISTLFVSLVVAFLLIPTATYFLLSRRKGAEKAEFKIVSQNNRLLQIYTLLLKSSLRHPLPVILGGVTLFFLSLFISLAQSLGVTQETETPDINFYVTMPSGSTLDKTATVVGDIESRLEPVAEKQDIISKIYEEEAVITIKLQEEYQEISNRNVVQIKEDIRQKTRDIPDADVSFEQPASSRRFRGGAGANFSQQFERMLGIGSQTEKVVIKGHDFDFMRSVAEQIEDALETSSSISSAWMSIPGERPEMHLNFDVAALGHYDISLANIARELSSFQDNFSSGITFKQGTEEYDIVIRGSQDQEEVEKNIYDLQQLEIPGGSGSLHPLSQISDMVYAAGLASITRTNQERQIEVTYQFLPEINNVKSMLESARTEVDQIIAGFELPTGIFIDVVHEDSSFEIYYFLIAAALILIYLILASVFESLFMPFVILFTVPLAGIGAIWALILTNTSIMNMNVLTGMLILLGIVVNNGIIYLDYTNILRSRGFSRSRALIVAGQARVRPILITAITTIIAMLPLAMGRAEYVIQIGAPFAITVIGGLALSTLFTLVFIPTVYSGMESAINWFQKLSLQLRLLQLSVFILACFLIYSYIESILWIIIFVSALILVVPGVTYFILNSLRQASAEYIRPDEKIAISVTNVSKIYDRPGRFIREWKKPERMKGIKTGNERVSSLLWQAPLFVFLLYFIYGYLKSDFWIFVLCHVIYFYMFYLWNYLNRIFKIPGKILKIDLSKLLFWGVPSANLAYFLLHGWGIAGILIIAILWYLALIVYTTSNSLQHHKVNINRLSGRFAGLRRRFYRFVQSIPIIGKKRIPFPALAGVSLEIGTGMFGLLGPNGAGKTTLMRIICGVLDQNYGKIRINGIDTTEKREELQGLIGYLPQEFGMYENMTAYEFLDYQAVLKNIMEKSEREQKIESVLKAVHMIEHKNETIGSFSGGMKQRIGIAQTLLHLPRILVVDEPTAGLDPRERIRFRNLLVELSRDRIVLFSTHVIEDISSSCREVAVLNRGKLCFLGTPTGMTKYASGSVWQFYISLAQFEQVRKEFLVVHHMREGERIRIRCLSKKQPFPDAQTVNPTLEDAYLWLLREVA
jgi:multidrug efflux pump subunit AcrB/ABC-type multidrug transport system ATPase subunit